METMRYYKMNKEIKSRETRAAEFVTLDDLLRKQTKGKVPLTREEKLRVQKYAENKRKERKK